MRQVLDDPNLTKATSINDIPLFATSPRRARNTRDDRLSGGRHRRYDASSRCSIVNRPSREAPDDHHVSRPGHSMASTLAVPRPLASVQRQSRSLWGGSRRRGASIGSMSLPAPRRRSPDFCQWVRKNSRIFDEGVVLQTARMAFGKQPKFPRRREASKTVSRSSAANAEMKAAIASRPEWRRRSTKSRIFASISSLPRISVDCPTTQR